MKRIFIGITLLLINLPANALTELEIKDVCNETIAIVAEMQNANLRIQKAAEDTCFCMGQEMPNSMSKQKFKELIVTQDVSIKDIYQICLRQVLYSIEMQMLIL